MLPNLCHLTQLSSLQLRSSATAATRNNEQHLPGNLPQHLQMLDLSGTWIWGVVSAKDAHEFFNQLPRGLTSLDITKSIIPPEELIYCITPPPLLQEVKISLRYWLNPQVLDALPGLPCTFLHVATNQDARQEQFAGSWFAGVHGKDCLRKLTGLHWELENQLQEQDDPRSHDVLTCLAAGGEDLRFLAVTGCAAGVRNLSLLSCFTQLTSLCFSYSGPPDGEVVPFLISMWNLQQLRVAGLSAGQVGALQAAAASWQLPCLKHMNSVASSRELTPFQLEALSGA